MTKRHTFGAGLLAATALLAAQAAWAADAGGQSFLTKAMQGNLAEISMGKLAQDKGGTDAVRSFGAMLVTDHTAANSKAMQAAQSLGVTGPTEPTPEQKQAHDKLAAESNPDFDRDFASAMVQDHQKDISDYTAEAGSTAKDAASGYANETLPTLRKHLGAAEALVNNTGAQGSTAAGSAVPPLAGANSFTEGQAKSRIEAAGFSGVSTLSKDDQGIWRGTASKNGASVPVALDFKGNVVGR